MRLVGDAYVATDRGSGDGARWLWGSLVMGLADDGDRCRWGSLLLGLVGDAAGARYR
jgi:hypothetical protein